MVDAPTLIRRFALERREEDFAEIVRQHIGLVYRVALQRTNGDTYLAEDVAQQVFTLLARDAAKVQEHPRPTGWLYVTTRHTAGKAMRSEQRRRARELEANIMNAPESTPEPAADWHKLRAELDRVIEELPEKDRDAVLLRFFSDQPYSAVAEALQTTENAARMRVDRALDRLRELLGKRGIVSTAAAITTLLAQQASAAVPAALPATITTAALAAGVSAAAAGGLIGFMTTTKMLSVTGALVCVLAGVMFWEGNELHATRAADDAQQQRNEAVRSELESVRPQVSAAEQRKHKADEQTSALEKQLSMLTGKIRRPVNTDTDNSPPPNVNELLFSNPEYQRVWFQYMRLALGPRYAPLYQKLHLTPKQIADFEDAYTATQEENIDLRSAILDQTGKAEMIVSDTFKPLQRGMKEKLDVRIKEILGDNGYAMWVKYESIKYDNTAITVAMDLFYSDTPLKPDQAQYLGIMIANNSKIENGVKTVNWAAALNLTEKYLSPPQREALNKTIERTRLEEELRKYRINVAKIER